ncbi:MAG TPA: glucose-6-phosphate isomerase family protein [Prolixibacteraceae bacterium]|nr:glucose-6-phosphate isomerase family protein [Prolixibacteraceae bacterium]
MNHLKIFKSPVELALDNFALKGEPIVHQLRMLKDVAGIFHDQVALTAMNPETQVYSVQSWLPVAEGTPGGLFFGASTLMPGKVGDEYFMTKGHFHAQSDRAEFYWGVQGNGMLILMDRDRHTWGEKVFPGSLHYISSEVAHRLANTGSENLVVGACWPSDAGHDYEEIAVNGFSARLLERDGQPMLMES